MTTESFFFLVIMTGEWSWQTFSIVFARFCLAFVYVMASMVLLPVHVQQNVQQSCVYVNPTFFTQHVTGAGRLLHRRLTVLPLGGVISATRPERALPFVYMAKQTLRQRLVNIMRYSYAKERRPMAYILPICLLAVASIIITFAWYFHLKVENLSIFSAILMSWGIALLEYAIAIPAIRMGSKVFSLPELETIRIALTLFLFAVVVAFVFKQKFSMQHLLGFGLITAGAFFVFRATEVPS